MYYLAFPHDKTMHKVVVWTVYGLETIHSLGLAAGLSIMMVNMNSNAVIITIILIIVVGALGERCSHRSMLGITMILSVTLIAQCLYAYRIHAITDMTIIPAGITIVCDADIS